MSVNGAVPLTHRRLSSSDLALAGVGLLRREPGTWAAWAAVSLVVSAVLTAATGPLLGDSAARMQLLRARPDPAQAAALLARIAPVAALLGVAALAFYAVMTAALIRALLRPEAGGWRHLRLGADELRQAGAMAAVWALVTAAYVGLLLAALVLGALTPQPARAPVSLLLAALALAGVVTVGVRLSLASAATFDAGRVRVFEAWRLTRGVAWPLFGAFVLSFVIVGMLGVVCWMLVAGVQLATGGAGAPGRSFAAQVVALLLGAAVFPVNLLLLAGPPVAAFRALARPVGPPGGRWPGAEAALRP